MLSYIAAQLLQTALIVFAVTVLITVGALTGLQALAALGGVIGFVATCYIFTKLSLAAPVIAIDGERNPVRALARSWTLTKGNSIRLFFFYLLLFIALVVVSGVIGMIVMLVFGLMGEEVMLIGSGLINSAVNAVVIVLMLGVLAAVHRQLAGPSAESMGETFE